MNRTRSTAVLVELSLVFGIVGLATASCGGSGDGDYGCQDPQEITPNVDGNIFVDEGHPSADAKVDLSVAFELACDGFDITDKIALQSVTLVDAKTKAVRATLDAAFPSDFDATLVCKHDAPIPGITVSTKLTDEHTANAKLAALCGESLVLELTIERSGCTGKTTAKTSSFPFTLQCTGIVCDGKACGTNESCCNCHGTPTCLDGCQSFGCDPM
jgi:hypothetical protein